MMTKSALLAVLVLLCARLSGQIVTYNFGSLSGGSIPASVPANSNYDQTRLLPGDITRGTGISAIAQTGAFSARTWTTAGTRDGADYFQFVLTPQAGHNMTVDGISFTFDQGNGNGPNAIDVTYRVGTGAETNASNGIGLAVSNTPKNVSIGVGPITESVTIRIYGYSAGNTNGTGFLSGTLTVSGVLPIRLVDFSAQPTAGGQVLLEWATAAEENNAYMAVERGGVAFAEIGRVAGQGASAGLQQYRYTDVAPAAGWNYYRLRQVDFDGAFTYSPVRAVLIAPATHCQVYPQPATDHLTVQWAARTDTDLPWQLYDAQGRLARTGAWPAGTQTGEIGLADLPAGPYVLRVEGVGVVQGVWKR